MAIEAGALPWTAVALPAKRTRAGYGACLFVWHAHSIGTGGTVVKSLRALFLPGADRKTRGVSPAGKMDTGGRLLCSTALLCAPVEQVHPYGLHFRRTRLAAAIRLARPDYETLDGAARAIGISESALKQIESGKRRPSLETLEDMARAYNLLPGDMLPSSAPSGPEVAQIIGPLATLPPDTRSRFITQMSAFAIILATELNEMRAAMAETRMYASVPVDSGHKSNEYAATPNKADGPPMYGLDLGEGADQSGEGQSATTGPRRHGHKAPTSTKRGNRA